MALYDTDKNSEDRGSPMPNHDDRIIDGAHKAHGTNSVNYTTDASNAGTGPKILGGIARLVKSGTAITTIPDGTPGQVTTTSTTVAHNLGYAPLAQAFLNGANINPVGPFNVNLALPAIISVGDNTGATGSASDYLGIQAFMEYAVDSTNFYIITISSGGMATTKIAVTFYLYQQTAK